MGRHDRRHSPKMKQRKEQRKAKLREARKHPATKGAKGAKKPAAGKG
ncbi:MAG: hypothetical protein HY905_10440 [Deltaproteobacteria bacterium]|nr:hypothetical protein [Deltaproteobacteria bacterium]